MNYERIQEKNASNSGQACRICMPTTCWPAASLTLGNIRVYGWVGPLEHGGRMEAE